MSLVAAAEILRTPGSSSLHSASTRVSPPDDLRTSERCERTVAAAIEKSSMRIVSGSASSSISRHSLSRSSKRSTTRNAEMT